MRSLGSIRARVERLASTWPTSPHTTFVSWIQSISGARLGVGFEVHAQAKALAAAVKGRDPRELPPRLVWYSTDDLTTCPRCGGRFPRDGA